MSKFYLGSSWPLGSTITKRGVNFSVAAPEASYVELLLFSRDSDLDPIETITLDKSYQSGDYWHIEVEGLTAGCLYCYRVIPKPKINTVSDHEKFLLIDPCARAITGWDIFQNSTLKSKRFAPYLKGVVCERDLFDFESHPRPRLSLEKTVIYELHVGGFTRKSGSSMQSIKKGTFLGLIEKIPYLKDLGITTIELLPIFAFDPYDAPKGLTNFWGYSPLNWFTPHQDYIVSNDPLNARAEFKEFVAFCHDQGIEVLLDVVYNHTAEGNQDGPVISWKGFGENIYYHKDKKKKDFLDVSGCGNTISANQPIVRHLILESMRCWANELGVDGFRFDLGIALSRGEALKPLENPPIFEEIEADPSLSQLKLISEPWDCGGLYRLTDFPAKTISTWNGHFRDNLRKFWKGDKNCAWDLKDMLRGSQELYKKKSGSAKSSINLITSHDGFTLKDLISFNNKHNLANGENNRDGDNCNNSWNHGIEGPTMNKDLQNLRSKQQRNLLSTLLLSPGIPMISMGDEVGRSQGGNNNTWCQNSTLGWMIWDKKNCDENLKRFVKKLIFIRSKFPQFFNPCTFLNDQESSKENELWIQWHGIELNKPDWGSWSHTISYSINLGNKGSLVWIGLNAYNESMKFNLPKPLSSWSKILDTAVLEDTNFPKKAYPDQENIQIENRSLVLMISHEYSQELLN